MQTPTRTSPSSGQSRLPVPIYHKGRSLSFAHPTTPSPEHDSDDDDLFSPPLVPRSASMAVEKIPLASGQEAGDQLTALGCSPRRMTRKQPPRMTESLEFLALFPSKPTSTIQAVEPTQTLHQLEVSPPLETLEVDEPLLPATSLPSRKSSRSPQPPSPTRKPSAAVFGINETKTPPTKRRVLPGSISTPMPSLSERRPSTIASSEDSSPPRTPSRVTTMFNVTWGGSSDEGARSLRSTASSSHMRVSSSADGSPFSCSSGSASTCGSWSTPGDSDVFDRPAGAGVSSGPRESRKERKARKAAEKAAFDADTPPSMRQLFEASLLDVIDEKGAKVKFGDLVRGRKTMVIFIRHWYCTLCAQYMDSIIKEVSPEALDEADLELIIIGNGSNKMIDGYRNKSFRCPFKMYTDPTLALYRALGLTRQTTDAGPDEEKGDYLVQSGLEQTVSTLKRATKMPLRNPGHFLQLGGEFVFDGTLNVTYTHRMTTTRSHAPIRDVCAEAGVRLEFIHYEPGAPPPLVHRLSARRPYDTDSVEARIEAADLDDWQAERDAQLARIRQLKAARRIGMTKGMEGEWARSESVVIAQGQEEADELQRRFGALGLSQ
ncbi:hypothetical protein EHS25_006203 [Saitozyma podzolica]|uniref:Uncharacterized protein n=1 Tax=Saitozyma podzolica TaxID=1890683 RepID=A0A427XS35_9TREE|nr:hypothetical protein EHS25_006203 [Saitozyma podzolica]